MHVHVQGRRGGGGHLDIKFKRIFQIHATKEISPIKYSVLQVMSTLEGASLFDSQNSRSSSSPLAAVFPSSVSMTIVSMPMLTSPEGLVSSLACPEMSIREGSATAGGRGRDGRREMRDGGGEGGREGGRELQH